MQARVGIGQYGASQGGTKVPAETVDITVAEHQDEDQKKDKGRGRSKC